MITSRIALVATFALALAACGQPNNHISENTAGGSTSEAADTGTSGATASSSGAASSTGRATVTATSGPTGETTSASTGRSTTTGSDESSTGSTGKATTGGTAGTSSSTSGGTSKASTGAASSTGKGSTTSGAGTIGSSSGGSSGATKGAGLAHLGMNISGLDLASTAASLADPTPITHFASLGFDIFRIPFKWEQLTPTLGGSLSTTLMPLMMNFVTLCTSTQVICILDMHNYAQYNGQLIGASGGPTQADLVSAWSQLAAYSGIKNNQYIRFGIMNEPSGGLTTAEWQTISNATVAGIRAAGATNTVQVTAPGGGMDIGTIPGFVDSANAQIYEGHQYTDTGSAGVGRVANTYEYIALTDIFVGQYLQLGSTMKLMWGEVGFDNAATALTSENLWLQYVQQNSDIFEGVTFWGAGKEFGTSYVYDMNPNNGVEQPQVVEAENFLPGGSSYGVVEPIDAYTPTLLGGSSAAFTAAKSGPFPKSSKGSVGETSAQIETPYWPDPKGSTALTSEVWFNAASAAQAGSGTLVGGNGTQQVAIYGTNLELTSGNSSTVVSYTTPVAPYLDGKWHHFEVDADGTGTWMFIDGQSVKTSTTGWSASGPSEQFPMGVRSNGKSGGTASTAALAGAAFWTYARHTANFTLATDYYAGTESGIAAYFPLNGDIDCWL